MNPGTTIAIVAYLQEMWTMGNDNRRSFEGRKARTRRGFARMLTAHNPAIATGPEACRLTALVTMWHHDENVPY